MPKVVSAQPNREDIMQVIAMIDANKDGVLQTEELMAWVVAAAPSMPSGEPAVVTLKHPLIQETVVVLPGGATMAMVWIPPGTFTMGTADTDPWWAPDESPPHQVAIPQGVYLGKYELTELQWASVMEGAPVRPNAPKTEISWNKVQTFIDSLNTLEGVDVYRLPTEAEWEYACRGGTTTLWSFGNDGSRLEEYAWYVGNSGRIKRDVGTKFPNAWGLHDMHGNVSEWVQDRYGESYYSVSPGINPPGPAGSGSFRVFRGGNSSDGAPGVRSAIRSAGLPDRASPHIGVRLVRRGP